MIDKQLIESAKSIRKEFIKISNSLNNYHDDVKNLADFYFKKVEELKSYNKDHIKKIRSKEDLDKVTKHLVQEIELIEVEERKLSDKVEKLNLDLEKLNKDENILYETIKSRYPDLSDDQIVKEIQSHLDK
jgi:chromosome segregation ATPase